MTIEIRTPGDDDLAQLVAVDSRNFGAVATPAAVERARARLDLDRFLVAEDGGDIVAVAGSHAMELTLPGATGAPTGATVPLSGVTWVSVLASHTRRGILRQLMTELATSAGAAGEPVLGLTASEGAIYERFGYGTSTRDRIVEIDRRRAEIRPAWRPEPGSVRLVDPAGRAGELQALFDRYRRTQAGEVSRHEQVFRQAVEREDGPAPFAAIHDDGYALWTVTAQWHRGHPAHELFIEDLIAASPEAHVALWDTILSIDLVGPITSHRAVAHDDPLPLLLTDPRSVRTVEANDFLWLRVQDVAQCFGARSYRIDDRLVIGVVEGAEEVVDAPSPAADHDLECYAIGPDGAERCDDRPELVVCRSALGPLLLGDASASQLAASRRLVGPAPVLARADALLGTGRLPHCRTAF